MNNDEFHPHLITDEASTQHTCWTDIIHAGSGLAEAERRRALNLVTQRYRPMILGFIRKNGINYADAEDVCHDYLYKEFTDVVTRADRSKGRFRTFLFHTLRRWIASHWRAENAAKRGGGRVVSLEAAFANGDWGDKLEDAASLDQLDFEVDLALCTHSEVLQILRRQYESRGEIEAFDALSPHLLETTPGLYDSLATTLKREPAAVRKVLSRLRERYVEAMLERVRIEAWNDDEDPKAELKEILKLVIVGTSRKAGERPA